MKRIIPLLILLFLLVITPASAKDEVWYYNTEEFTATASDSMMIQSIRAENLKEGTVQHFVFDSYGETYYLAIESSPKDWGWWNFDATCIYPDGTTQEQHLSKFAPISFDYDINIQSYWLFGDLVIDTNIYVTLLPLSLENNPQTPITAGELPEGYPTQQYMPICFSYVQGISNAPFEKVTVYYVTPEEFEQIKENDLLLKVSEGIGDLFAWTWDMVLGAISKIPYVGQFFVTVVQIAAIFVEEAIFWINLLLIQNWALFIMTMEFFAVGEAIYQTKNKVDLLTRIVENHIKIIKFFVFLGELAINLVMKIIQTVAVVVQMIKPI